MQNPLRFAAPTAAVPRNDSETSEGRADPHGIHWMRGAPPIDAHIVASADCPYDLVAQSVARGTDDGKGNGRRGCGFRATAAGTLVLVTGAGQTETWALQAGEGDDVEIKSITSWSGATGIRVYW